MSSLHTHRCTSQYPLHCYWRRGDSSYSVCGNYVRVHAGSSHQEAENGTREAPLATSEQHCQRLRAARQRGHRPSFGLTGRLRALRCPIEIKLRLLGESTRSLFQWPRDATTIRRLRHCTRRDAHPRKAAGSTRALAYSPAQYCPLLRLLNFTRDNRASPS